MSAESIAAEAATVAAMSPAEHITRAARLFAAARDATGSNPSGHARWMAEAQFHATLAAAKGGTR